MDKNVLARELLRIARMLTAAPADPAVDPADDPAGGNAGEESVADQKGQGAASFWDVSALKAAGFKLTTRLGEIDSQDKLAELMRCVKRSTTVNKSFREFKNGK